MNTLALPVVATVLIVGSSVAGVLGLLLARRVVKPALIAGHNEIIALMFATVALLYSVLLAFVVFAVWQRFADSSRSVTDEAAAAVTAYRDTQLFPEPYRSDAQAAYRGYVAEVTSNEWASHGQVLVHRSRDALNPVWNVYRQVQAVDLVDQSRLAAASERLSALELQRHLRHLAGEASLPNVFWALLVGGGIVTVAMSYLIPVERGAVHAMVVALLGGFIAGVLTLIFALNFPFTGPVHVSRSPFKHAVQEFTATNLPAKSGDAGAAEALREQAVVVDARTAWNDAGLDLAAGDRVSVRAAGAVSYGPSSTTGPDGVLDSSALRQDSVIAAFNHGGLIGKVGANGTPFAIGSAFSSGDLGAGRLYLGVNDKGVDNNGGAFSAVVTVRKP